MCGRFVTPPVEELVELFHIAERGGDLPEPTFQARPSFGIRPEDTQPPVPAVIDSAKDGRRRLVAAHWQFIPSWAKQPLTLPTFNARAEDAAAKSTWKDAVRTHRALLPAVGYYETQGSGKARQRFYFHPDDGEVLALGGVYSWWRPAPDEWLLTVAILTMPAVPEVAQVHDRSPLIVPRDAWDGWLDPGAKADQGFLDAAIEASKPLVAALRFFPTAWTDEEVAPHAVA